MSPLKLAFDSNAVTYFVRVNAGEEPLAMAPGPELLACLRLFLVHDIWILPTVAAECAAIRKTTWRNDHQRFIWGLCGELFKEDFERRCLAARLRECRRQPHRVRADCRIVAEARCSKLDALVTNDPRMRRRHSGLTDGLPILSPSEAWERFKAPQRWSPGEGHPLEHVEWYRW
jgi:hypothetical protein